MNIISTICLVVITTILIIVFGDHVINKLTPSVKPAVAIAPPPPPEVICGRRFTTPEGIQACLKALQ